MEDILASIQIPKQVENLQLPDPGLVDYYKDAANRIYWIDGEIDDCTLEIVKNIMRVNKEDENTPVEKRVPIKIFINSNGGDVSVLWTLVQAMKHSKTPVYTINYCIALSAAAHILAAGHKRYALHGTTVMVHSGSCSYTGNVEQVESARKYYNGMSDKANALLLADTKIDPKILKKRSSSDWYMDEEEALKNGVIDAIVDDITEVI